MCRRRAGVGTCRSLLSLKPTSDEFPAGGLVVVLYCRDDGVGFPSREPRATNHNLRHWHSRYLLPTLSASTGSSRLCPGARVAGSRLVVTRHQHPPATSTAAYCTVPRSSVHAACRPMHLIALQISQHHRDSRRVAEFLSRSLGLDDAATYACMAGGAEPLDVIEKMEQPVAFKAPNGFRPQINSCVLSGPQAPLQGTRTLKDYSDNLEASSILTNTVVSTGVVSTQAWTADACAAANDTRTYAATDKYPNSHPINIRLEVWNARFLSWMVKSAYDST
ncbi:hypothetical protein PpBr36_01614 [Pyricularia pennisetigena]|uniref:hypothetical protein n=1 Tax=Pyricularia pennisetigena TaxID=1578925 RepID=UPI00114E704F|nr:hypothetical protein PpBr36_01614 [Pyricularia pennisetigena]TLS28959.1 hypothetical protein PpBr36_01614 [Pyricularia pennisetigena]